MDKPSFWIFAVVFYTVAFWFLGTLDFDGVARVLMAVSIAAIPLMAWMGDSRKKNSCD